MSSAQHMKELLRPLGIYKLENSFLGSELDSLGQSLDTLQRHLEQIQREMCLTTAQAEGLDKAASLFAQHPVTEDAQQLARSLMALSRIGGDSFTLEAINNTVSGCGLNVAVSEAAEPGVVNVRFPDVPGIPEGFDRMRQIIEDILPAHVLIQFLFWYMTWEQLEARGLTWQMILEENMTWQEFETMVD